MPREREVVSICSSVVLTCSGVVVNPFKRKSKPSHRETRPSLEIVGAIRAAFASDRGLEHLGGVIVGTGV